MLYSSLVLFQSETFDDLCLPAHRTGPIRLVPCSGLRHSSSPFLWSERYPNLILHHGYDDVLALHAAQDGSMPEDATLS